MQEYEQFWLINWINEDASGTEEERYYLTHNAVLKSSSSKRSCYFNTPLQSFTPVYYTLTNRTGFAVMVCEPFVDDVSHVHAAHRLLWCCMERAEVPTV
jgi:hypothetical protein